MVGDQGTGVATILLPGGGTQLEARGSEMLFKAVGATTGGRFSLMDRMIPPRGRAPVAHRHPDALEMFVVLEGSLTFTLDDQDTVVGAGGCVIVPGGTSHTFVNASDEPARTLIIHAPALDGYFEDLAALWSRHDPPTVEDEMATMLKHGIEPVR
jgi:mannose-6-phosphate isomerase-like protein (cupin superfamily)